MALWVALQQANSYRGPDAESSHVARTLSSHGSPILLRFYASELRLRGNHPITQPHLQHGNVLCWNGEVFSGLGVRPQPLPAAHSFHLPPQLQEHENDGEKLFATLQGLVTHSEFSSFFASIEGPYSFVYFHASSRCLWFGRDPLGRRSLLCHKPTIEKPFFLLTSVSAGSRDDYELEEVPTNGLYCIDVKDLNIDEIQLEAIQQVAERTSCHGMLSPLNRALPQNIPAVPAVLDTIPPHFHSAVQSLWVHLSTSVRLRVQDIPRRRAGEARVAVLFSGGIDSTVVAYLAHIHLPIDEPIDLLNVAFENPRKNLARLRESDQAQRKTGLLISIASEVTYQVPDRVTGLEELRELQRLCVGRTWNFVEINVPHEESQRYKSKITSLMFPRNTVMDLSLASALFFSARGVGHIHGQDPEESYTSPARVLLSGLGSDEMLGGYGRHRTAFFNGGWAAVIDELQLELDRIPLRNLGRDDRIISAHGKEARYPFLALPVVNFIAQLPVHLKLDPRAELGLGDKMLLRFAARFVGLELASSRKKKAMQFGSHSARMEGGMDRKGNTVVL